MADRSAEELARAGHAADLAGNAGEALELFERAVSLFGDDPAPETRRWIAVALESKADVLEEAGASEESLEVRDEVIARFGEDREPDLLDRVSIALNRKGLLLRRLGRAEEALRVRDEEIARYRTTLPPEFPLALIDALAGRAFVLEQLGRSREVIATCDELLERAADIDDPDARRLEAWGLLEQARMFNDLGEAEAVLAELDRLLERFGESTELVLRWYVAEGLWVRVLAARALGMRELSAATLEQVIERFAAETDVDIARIVARAFHQQARDLEAAGKRDQALALYSVVIERSNGSSDHELRRLLIDSLRRTAEALEDLGRLDEALVAFNSVVAAYLDGVDASAPDSEGLSVAVLSLLRKAACLAKVDPAGSTAVVRQLAELLPDASRSDQDRRDGHPVVSDEDVAVLLADLCQERTWIELATSGDDEASRAEMARRALELYETTRIWLTGPAVDVDTPAGGAAMLVRNIAGGYALLSRSWRAAGREHVSLPSQLLVESMIRAFEIDEWAAELGHPVKLSDSEELADELIEDEREQSEHVEVDLAAHFIASVRHHEMLEILCDSPSGQAALQTSLLKSYAAERMNHARKMAGWSMHQSEDATGAAANGIFVTEALFIATNTTISSSTELFPNRAFLRSMLHESEAYDWLESEEVEVPAWLESPGDQD